MVKIHFLLVLVMFSTRVEAVCRTTPLTDLEQFMLDDLNHYRARHIDTPPLCYAEVNGPDITFTAQQWADHIAATDVFEHTPQPTDFGENMFYSTYIEPTPNMTHYYMKAGAGWYHEILNWDFKEHHINAHGVETHGTTTHFTQLVWRDSKQLNCGHSTLELEDMNKVFVVCQFFPKGNWVDQYATQVTDLAKGFKPDDEESACYFLLAK